MPSEDAEANRAAVVLHVETESIEAELDQQPLHDLGQVIEGVGEFRGVRHVGVAEAGIVRRDHVELFRQGGEQVPELVRGGGKSAQEHELG